MAAAIEDAEATAVPDVASAPALAAKRRAWEDGTRVPLGVWDAPCNAMDGVKILRSALEGEHGLQSEWM